MSSAHHWGAGVLRRRGFPLESCVARICREAGAQDLDLQGREQMPPSQSGRRRFASSTAHSLPWTPQWSAQCELTEPPRGSAERDGAALDQARRTKERTHPELTGEQGRARLVVLACETGGSWSEEAQDTWRARGHVQNPERCALQRGGRGCDVGALLWRVAPAAQAFASSLLQRRGGLGADGEIPSTSDVIWDDRQRGQADLLRTLTCHGFLFSFSLSPKKNLCQVFFSFFASFKETVCFPCFWTTATPVISCTKPVSVKIRCFPATEAMVRDTLVWPHSALNASSVSSSKPSSSR